MGWIKDLAESIKGFTQLEQVSIFCSTVIIGFIILKGDSISYTFIFYSLGIIIFSVYIGLHRTMERKREIDSEDSNKFHETTLEGFDFYSRMNKKHPLNILITLTITMMVIGTIYLVLEMVLKYL